VIFYSIRQVIFYSIRQVIFYSIRQVIFLLNKTSDFLGKLGQIII